jgi:hypothetical protein
MDTIKTAFQKGYFAARDGVVVGDNPYNDTTEVELHFQWMNGHTFYRLDKKEMA